MSENSKSNTTPTSGAKHKSSSTTSSKFQTLLSILLTRRTIIWGLILLVTLVMEAHYMKKLATFITLQELFPGMNVPKLFMIIGGLTGIVFVLVYLFLYLRKPGKKVKTEQTFALLYLILGLFFFASVPMYKVPDEPAHFYRAYEISEGHLIAQTNADGTEVGDELPDFPSMTPDDDTRLTFSHINQYKDVTLDFIGRRFRNFSGSALYAPGSYLPQAIGIAIGRLFTHNVLAIMYAGRIASWLITGIILFFCIRYLPFGKNLALVIYLLPLNLQQYVSLSADSFAFAMCNALLTFVLYMRFRKKGTMTIKNYVLMYAIILILCQCKVVYLAFLLLLFLIPRERFGKMSTYIAHICAVAVVTIGIGGGWFLFSSGQLATTSANGSSEKLAYLLQNPGAYINLIIKTLDVRTSEYILGGAGNYLGWQDVYTSSLLIITYILVVLTVFFLDNDMGYDGPSGEWILYRRTTFERIYQLFVTALVFLLIFTSIYLQWITKIGDEWIEGIQGRYLVPLLLPTMLAVKPPASMINNHGLDMKYIYPIILGINLCISVILMSYAM